MATRVAGGWMADRHGVSWRRLLSEAVVIVASVYLAIVLEGMSEVLVEQENLSRQYVNLLRWFGDPSSMPVDSVHESLDVVAWSNRTMFPRGAAWTTRVAAGQLRYLDDAPL